MKDHTELRRLLSKLGLASRKEAEALIRNGCVTCNGKLAKDPLAWVSMESKIQIQGMSQDSKRPTYLILNKPRGLVTTRNDEKGRPTVYECLKNWSGPTVMPVGRLDQASEGLLFFTNDHQWANTLMDPNSHIMKCYHVQINPKVSQETLTRLSQGVQLEDAITKKSNWQVLREGQKNAWLEVQLQEGRNRQIRRMLEQENVDVLRLIRIQIGPITLGDLPKGEWRELSPEEVQAVTQSTQSQE